MDMIARVFSATAQWLACLIFVISLPRRKSNAMTAVCMLGSLILLILLSLIIQINSLSLWILTKATALGIMYGTICICCRKTPAETVFYWTIAFIISEFADSLSWQMYSFAAEYGHDGALTQCLIYALCNGLTFATLLKNQLGTERTDTEVTLSQFDIHCALYISFGTFLISYMDINTPFSRRMGMDIYIIRTLVDLIGIVLLSFFQYHIYSQQRFAEMNVINSLLRHQYDQYKYSKNTLDLLNRKYHDLKHQLAVIRTEQEPDKKEEYLRQLESGMKHFDVYYQTGNPILDTVLSDKKLYCRQKGVQLNVVADGGRLSFMETMDICSIFGNALDNAIESVEKLSDPKMRIVQVAVFAQNRFLMIRVENYYESALHKDGNSFRTTKHDADYHGYGLKSIRFIAEKYGGSVNILTEDNRFSLRILIPLPETGAAAL